ncbi:MAG: hypothetical protein EA369_00895 [Bradymonadales bacterium]|nr:MAG: hypothetical protein EA369_00895 [Bradymonadales bacterium]
MLRDLVILESWKRQRHPRVHLIDVRKIQDFYREQLPGAIQIGLDEFFEEKVQEVVHGLDEMILLYSKESEPDKGIEASERLGRLGFRNVRLFWGSEGSEQKSLPA